MLSSTKTKKSDLRLPAEFDEDEEASIPDDSAVQAASQLDGLAHPWGSTTEDAPQSRVSTSVAATIAATPGRPKCR